MKLLRNDHPFCFYRLTTFWWIVVCVLHIVGQVWLPATRRCPCSCGKGHWAYCWLGWKMECCHGVRSPLSLIRLGWHAAPEAGCGSRCAGHANNLIITPEIASQNNSRANCHKYSHEEFRQGLKEIPWCHRKTYHSTAKAMGVALSTVQRMLLHRDVCRVHTSLKPTLMEENKMSRMELALSFMDKNNTSKFKNMEDLIHIDEKWFYLTKDGQRFIIAADKEEPYRHVQHKSFLTKIMFLCAVARPRYDTRRNAWFDREDWNLAYQEMGASEAVIKEACKGNACVEEPMHNTGCLL